MYKNKSTNPYSPLIVFILIIFSIHHQRARGPGEMKGHKYRVFFFLVFFFSPLVRYFYNHTKNRGKITSLIIKPVYNINR
jgi:hypothetical protein